MNLSDICKQDYQLVTGSRRNTVSSSQEQELVESVDAMSPRVSDFHDDKEAELTLTDLLDSRSTLSEQRQPTTNP
jgi:hypothetical protein